MADKNVNTATSSEAAIAIVDEDFLHGRIHEVRGQKVMLDFDLAEIYGYSTTAFNQQVKNNIEKFDEDFRFQLTRDEWANLISKNLTSSWGGRRKPPHAFTEQGVYMLMTVLRGDLATRQSKALIRLFKNMKDRIEDGAALVGRREFLSLSMAVSGNIAEVAELRRELNAVEGDVAAIINKMDDLARDFAIVPENEPAIRSLIYTVRGTQVMLDSDLAMLSAVLRSDTAIDVSVRIMDSSVEMRRFIESKAPCSSKSAPWSSASYVDVGALNILAKKAEGVAVTVWTHPRTRLTQLDIDAFTEQGVRTKEVFHVECCNDSTCGRKRCSCVRGCSRGARASTRSRLGRS